MPHYRYLHEPYQFGYSAEPIPCGICERTLPTYDLFDGRICEECFLGERLAEYNLSVNYGVRRALIQQIAVQYPDLDQSEQQKLAAERIAEVELRTPRPLIHNNFRWPAHCGDFFIFHKQINADDTNALAPDGDGQAFLAKYVTDDPSAEFLKNVWADDMEGFINFYYWECSACHTPLITWDSD